MILPDFITRFMRPRVERVGPPSSQGVFLPDFPDRLSVLVEPECGGGGGCPTVYQLGTEGHILIQGYPPTESDEASVRVSRGDAAVVIPSRFFRTVVQQMQLQLQIEDIFGPSSCRVYQWPDGDVVVRGVPAEDRVASMLVIPNGEIIVSLPRRSFMKIIRDVVAPEG